jgi:hypothetical protein
LAAANFAGALFSGTGPARAGVAGACGAAKGLWAGLGVGLETVFIAPPAGVSPTAQAGSPQLMAAASIRTTGRLGRLFMFFGKYGICQRFRHEPSENTIVRRSRGRRTFPTDLVLKGMNSQLRGERRLRSRQTCTTSGDSSRFGTKVDGKFRSRRTGKGS